MRTDEISDLLVAIDEAFPTDTWRIGGVGALPLFRYEVFNRNHEVYRRSSGAAPPPSGLGRRLLDEANANVRYARARVVDRAAEARVTTVDALLYSDGISFVDLGGKKYDRFCDPIRVDLEARGRRVLMVTPLHEYLVPRHSSSVFVQPAIERARLRAMVRSRLRPLAADLPGYADVVAAHPGVRFPEPAYLARSMTYVEEFAALCRRLLERTRPKVVYVVCYYGAERSAMLLAADRLGIPSVDVQHGYSGRFHWAYGRWHRVPKRGYELLPRWFWCWGAEDLATIEEWAGTSPDAPHRARIGGNRLGGMWLEGNGGVVADYDARVRALFGRHPAKKAVLFASNGLESDDQLRALGGVIAATQRDFQWYLRAHPCRLGQEARLEELVRAGGARDFEHRQATTLPLYALLRHVALHMTETSTTVMEATDFGVPTVLWGKLEAGPFASYVDSGMALPADTEDVPAALVRQLARAEELRRCRRIDRPSGLEDLLALAGPPVAAP